MCRRCLLEKKPKKIRMLDDLSRLDEASFKGLPIIIPKIPHVEVVLQSNT
jgi:hypothetical protein